MKRIITVIVILLITQTRLISQTCTPNLAAQNCETGKGISTNPNNPVNPECPNLVNNFDWRVKHTPGGNVPAERFWVYYDDDQNPSWVRNPFNGPINANYGDLTDNHNSNYHPEDGWELIKVEFGSLGNIGLGLDVQPGPNTVSNERPKLPYMILYNKYSGTMRFFGSLLEPDNTYETVRIELRIPKQSPPPKDPNQPYSNVYDPDLKATNLLSIQGESVQPLDQETEENSIVVFVKYTNNAQVFFWFDLPVAYDPCVCNSKVQLDVSFAFVQTADIDITGSLTGSIKTDKKGTQDYGKMVFSRILAAGVSGALAIKTGGAVMNVKAFVDLVDIVKDHPSRNQTEKDNLTELKNYLTCSEKMFSVIKGNYDDVTGKDKKKQIAAGQKILDANTTYLSSLVNGCRSSDNAASTITGAINASGTFTLTDDIEGTPIALALPGSDWSDKQVQSNTNKQGTWIPAYPTYNERLGTFALLETPKINLYRRHVRHDPDEPIYNSIGQLLDIIPGERINMYRLAQNSSIKYAFNPKMNVNETETEIQFRYVIKQKLKVIEDTVQFRNHVYQNHNLVQVDNSSLYPLSSPFMPIEYYQDFNPFVFVLNENQDHHPTLARDSIFIQFKISMVSNDIGREGPNSSVLFFTYPVDISFEEIDDLPVPDPFPSTQAEIEAWQNAVALRNVEIWNTFYANRAGIVNGGKEFNSDVTWSENTVLAYDGVVEISAKLASTAGKKVTIYSTMGFELLPGAEISPNIELIIGYPFESNPVAQQSYQQVSSFCSDNNKYKAQEFATEALAEERKTYEERARMRQIETMKYARTLKFAVKPNPTRNVTVLSWEGDEVPQHLKLLNGTGQLLFETPLSGDALKYDLDMSLFAHGVYYVILTTPSGKQGQQKLVKL